MPSVEVIARVLRNKRLVKAWDKSGKLGLAKKLHNKPVSIRQAAIDAEARAWFLVGLKAPRRLAYFTPHCRDLTPYGVFAMLSRELAELERQSFSRWVIPARSGEVSPFGAWSRRERRKKAVKA